ncbi:unnamed protein product [Alternaria alternata]
MASPQQGIVKGRSSTTRDPVTPSPGSIRPLLHVDSVKGSPDGGIALEPSDGAHTSLTTNDIFTDHAESECNTPTVKDENECQHSSFSLLLPPPPKLTDIDLLHKSSEQSPTPTCDATIQDPFLDFDANPRTPSLFKSLPARRFPNTSSSKPLTTQTQAQSTETVTVRSRNSPARQSIFEDGGVQLSPLSPNVCIERGPTRYHSARTSPIKERRAMRYNENRDEDGGIGLAQTEAGVQDSPLAPCKIGAGTRFQHPRHGVRGFGRFGRHLEQ